MTRRRRRKPFIPIKDLSTHAEPFVVLPALRAYWQVDDQTLRKWIREDALPAYRLGHAWRVKTADALAFQERNRFRNAS